MASSTTLLGAAGEHYVMSQLLRRGYIAALAPVGVPNSDIIVTDDIGERLCAVQVKSRLDKGSDRGWHMGQKHEDLISPTLFYAFVDFGKEDAHAPPQCWLMPSAVVADTVRRSHATWLAAPGKRGQARNDSQLRRLLPDYDRMGIDIGRGPGWMDPYRDAWHLVAGAAET